MTEAAKPLYVYVIGHDDGPQKVGFSNDPSHRAWCLKEAGKPHFVVHFAAEVPAEDARGVEALAHYILRDRALGKERFDVPPGTAIHAVSDAVARHATGEREPPRDDLMTERFGINMTESMIRRIDDWRVKQRPILSFGAAVRTLVTDAIEGKKALRAND